MKHWLGVAGVAVIGWFGLAGVASGASLVRILPETYSGSVASYLTAPPYDDRVFIGTRGKWPGEPEILVVEDGNLKPEPFLELDNVNAESERGFLSFAFDPDYAVNGRFYVFYNADGPDTIDPGGQEGDIRIVEYTRSAGNPDRADPASARLVLRIRHSAGNHNGGWIGFGPDNRLYISIGDNADPDNSQDLNTLLGKILRIDPADPAGPDAYSVPSDNPFAGQPGRRGEIWAYGVRNPFRASFHPDGRLIVADVGQSDHEEVNVGNLKGRNLGWPVCEGNNCDGAPANYHAPFFTYATHSNGRCAIIGGYVVRDPGLGSLAGRYLFGDYCSSTLETIDFQQPGGDPEPLGINVPGPLSFGEDSRGCLYLIAGDTVYRIAGEVETGTCPVAPPRATYRFTLRKRQVLASRIPISARCSLTCTVDATGTVKAKGRPRLAVRLNRHRWRLGAGRTRTVRLGVPARRMRALRKALRKKRKLTLTVRVTAVGDDGSRVKRTLKRRLVRGKRH